MTVTTRPTTTSGGQTESSAQPQTFVIDDAAIAQAPTPVELAVHPGDRIEIHLTRSSDNYTCCNVSGDDGVLTTVSGPTQSGGDVDAVYVVNGAGQETLTGQADPTCLQAQPPCGAPSRRITVNVAST